MLMKGTAGVYTLLTPCAVDSTSLMHGWRNSMRRNPLTACVNLKGWGALFDRTQDGGILQRNFGGHQYPRLAHVGDRTGLEMIRALQDHGIHQGIEVHMENTVVSLLKTGERVSGAFGYEREKGRFKVFTAKAVVLATGGVGKAYEITSNSWEYTGDGHSLAYHAGAELIDMEFVQFHPTGMVWPPSVRGILVTEGVRGEGGVLKNGEGNRFMFDDIPELYLLTRDHVARCIVREVQEGRGSPHGGVFLDIAWIKEHIRRKLPSMYHQFKELADIDITQEPMEVGPTTHYIMGGIRVDADSQMTAVPGLFAAGECAAGLHGANRLGGNSLSDLLVFGKRAGEYAAKFAEENEAVPFDESQIDAIAVHTLKPFENPADDGNAEKMGPYAIQAQLQEKMQELVGIARSQGSLTQALEEIQNLRQQSESVHAIGNREYNSGWHTALDLDCLLTVSEVIALAALERRASIGAHSRDDYPEKEEPGAGKYNTIVKKTPDGTMEIRRQPVDELRDDLQEIIDEVG
ncbi:Fumarate reductase (CoM/CoB) subunit A [Geodia barretti]|uniref:Fumarate reductase (CoM/CoB) subunit A n=1 Tax=Geodia barretti TaxID=519541 RepID=A0AA35TZR6_GEOBA|nr:Fumarate reductase (CoM/CoB) subunit A [Geodia barretti]